MKIVTKLNNFLISLALLVTLPACEGGTTYTKTIDNKSSETITVRLFYDYGNDESFIINSNETKEIYWDDQMASFADDSYRCNQPFDSVDLTITHNKILVKDFMNSDNWIRSSKGGRNSREDCTFIITNEDIQ